MKITGLSDAQVAESKAKYGDNRITEQAREGFSKAISTIQ